MKLISILLSFAIVGTGCATLGPEEFEKHGYHGTPEVKSGTQILPLDLLGNLVGIPYKLILFNWKVKRHRITRETAETVELYLKAHENELGNVAVQLNRWAAGDSLKRLLRNKRVSPAFRYTFGFLTVLVSDVLGLDRVLGGDRYNPFTHTVFLYSDLPSIALHELGHARDFSRRRYRGSYAMFRLFPFADLYQEYKASEIAFDYMRERGLHSTEIEAYKILYPAYGTYVGNYFFGMGAVPCALLGHLVGRTEASARQREFREGASQEEASKTFIPTEVAPSPLPIPPAPRVPFKVSPPLERKPFDPSFGRKADAQEAGMIEAGVEGPGERGVFPLSSETITWYGRFSQARELTVYWYTPDLTLYKKESPKVSFAGGEALARSELNFDPSLGDWLVGRWRVLVWEKDRLIDDRSFRVVKGRADNVPQSPTTHLA